MPGFGMMIDGATVDTTQHFDVFDPATAKS